MEHIPQRSAEPDSPTATAQRAAAPDVTAKSRTKSEDSPLPAGAKSVPRAPGRLPLLGHALPLARSPLGFVSALRDTADLVRVDIATLPVYFVNSFDLAHDVMVAQATSFEKGRFFDRLRSLVGNGLATADAQTHRVHRRLMQPLFHRDRIAAYAELMALHAGGITESWTPGMTVAVDDVMNEFVVTTVAASMFSSDIGAPARECVQRNMPVIIKNLLLRTVSPEFLDRVPIPANRRFDTATRELHEVLDEVIAAARTAGAGYAPDVPDVLSTLLEARDADTGEPLSDTEVRDELGTILFAGAEATASTLAWVFHEIARRPEIEEQLVAEITRVVGDGPVTFQHVRQLPLMQRVLDETVRLHGVTLLMRRAVKPVTLGGYLLSPGTEVAFSLYALHRDPRAYPDPERFDPDRWLPENAPDRRAVFMPFGAGNRKCIGDAFAWTAIIIALATILPRWQLRHVPGRLPKEATSAVPHPDRLPMTVLRRDVPAVKPS
ncbi:cytochrome P450 [Streptomyces sp. NPDC058691]|uniref:cytochrome P450 n=1 Tax=Streptomyces sp. NPDC058691 TaxID=3346601 RepID=UPI0036470276